MEYRSFGNTGLRVSAVGFGAWAIGGAAMAGALPIGWGPANDDTSRTALWRAYEQGITFFDTADFYGLGRSETLIGEVLGDRRDVVIATKVGHRLDHDGRIFLDYSKDYILQACEMSLIRLQRETIDFYQLHTAKVADLEQGACIEAMEALVKAGKIRYWGISLNTFHPGPEAEYILRHHLGNGFQLVLNILNQRAADLLPAMAAAGHGVIARMPLQFGLLSRKFNAATTFQANDHRSFRLPPDLLQRSLDALAPAWPLCEKYGTTPAGLALSFILSFPQVSTVIPGIRTPEQAERNAADMVTISDEDHAFLRRLYQDQYEREIMPALERVG